MAQGMNFVVVQHAYIFKCKSCSSNSVFSRLNAGGVYLKLGLVDPAFIRTQRLFGARRLFIKCIFPFLHFFSIKFQQKR